uniref:BTB domain-containing protein n=1 Tax=Panagrolaimus sp. ES5 TaxID=591445 RepID=A0AC34F7W2_9BILA
MNAIESKLASECRIGTKWRIKKNHLQNALHNLTNIRSKAFLASNIPGLKYSFSLELDNEDLSEVNIFLSLNFKITKRIEANFKISVKSAAFEQNFEGKVYDESTGWGGTMCTLDELFNVENNFFVDKFIEIDIDGILKPLGIKRKRTTAAESSSLVKVLWNNIDDKNLTIIIKKQQIKVHKWIMCAKSSVFKAELNNPAFVEAQKNEIEITHFSPEIVKGVIKFCYEQDITKIINVQNAFHYLRFADKYDVKDLHEMIQSFLIETLSESNVCLYAEASIIFNAHELREFCICFLMNSVGKPIKGAEKLPGIILKEIGRRSFLYTSQ